MRAIVSHCSVWRASSSSPCTAASTSYRHFGATPSPAVSPLITASPCHVQQRSLSLTSSRLVSSSSSLFTINRSRATAAAVAASTTRQSIRTLSSLLTPETITPHDDMSHDRARFAAIPPTRPIPYPSQPNHPPSHPSRLLTSNATREDCKEQFVYIYDPFTDRDYYLVGVIHTRALSIDDVKQTIQLVRPGSVLVEFDEERAKSVEAQLKEGAMRDGSFDWKGKGGFGERIMAWQASKFYADIEKNHGIIAGAELIAAIDEGRRIGAQIVYGDIHDFTLKAGGFWNGIKWWMAISRTSEEQVSYALHSQRGEDGSKLNIKEAMERASLHRGVNRYHRQRLRTYSPSLAKAIYEDREQGIFHALTTECTSKVVVGVVGASHLPGLEDLFYEYLTNKQQNAAASAK